jgi:hypothetical protein
MPIISIEQVTHTGELHEYLHWVRGQLRSGKMSAAEVKRRVAEARRRLEELKNGTGDRSSG